MHYQLNAASQGNNLQATIDSTGLITITTSNNGEQPRAVHRQSIAVSALALANQSQQSVLQLLR